MNIEEQNQVPEDDQYWGELRKYVDAGGQMQDNWPDYHKHNFSEMKKCDAQHEYDSQDDPRTRGLNNG